MTDQDWQVRRDEIAGWLEFDCGLTRAQAEYHANLNVIRERKAAQ